MTKKAAIILAVIIIIQVFTYLPVSAVQSLNGIDAECALLIEKDSGIVLYEQNAYQRHPADSLARIMTLVLAVFSVENDIISDNEIIEMTEDAWHDIDEDSRTLGIEPGQMMTFIDLMYSAFTGGADEACNMLAIRIAGSISEFTDMMNERVRELGCSDTNFVNPHGKYHSNQYTTAYDMYIIYSEALKSALFRDIAGTYRHVTEWIEQTDSRTLFSSNALMNQSSIYYYKFCTSGLSSSSYEGGQSLVSAAEEDGLTLICVMLGAREVINDDDSVTQKHFTESNRLYTWGYTNYGWQDILKTTDLLARVPVMHGSGADFVNVRPEYPLTLLLPVDITPDSFTYDIKIYSEVSGEDLVAPVYAGDVLGEIVVSKDGDIYDTILLIANTDIELNPMEYTRRGIASIMRTRAFRTVVIILLVIIVIYAALIVRYNIMRINRLRRIKNARNDVIRDKFDDFKN